MRIRAPRVVAAAGATAALLLAPAPAQASFMECNGSWSSGAQYFNIRETPGDYGAAHQGLHQGQDCPHAGLHDPQPARGFKVQPAHVRAGQERRPLSFFSVAAPG